MAKPNSSGGVTSPGRVSTPSTAENYVSLPVGSRPTIFERLLFCRVPSRAAMRTVIVSSDCYWASE